MLAKFFGLSVVDTAECTGEVLYVILCKIIVNVERAAVVADNRIPLRDDLQVGGTYASDGTELIDVAPVFDKNHETGYAAV